MAITMKPYLLTTVLHCTNTGPIGFRSYLYSLCKSIEMLYTNFTQQYITNNIVAQCSW